MSGTRILLVALFAGALAPAACGGLQSGDEALFQRVVARPPNDLDGVRADLVAIEDPIVRQAALLEWVRRNSALQPQGSVAPLCDLLDGVSRDTCQRRVASPHLAGPR